jgi:hypothetical protein
MYTGVGAIFLRFADHIACCSSLKTTNAASYRMAFMRLEADERFLMQMQMLRESLLLMLGQVNGLQSAGNSVDAADARLQRYLAALSDETLRAAVHWPPAIQRQGTAWPAHRVLLVWVPHATQPQQRELLHVGMNDAAVEEEKEEEED